MPVDKIRLSDYGKLLVMLAVIVSVTVLALADKVSGNTAAAAVIGVLGYVAGNGVTALRRQPPSPVVVNKEVGGQLAGIRRTNKRKTRKTAPDKNPDAGPTPAEPGTPPTPPASPTTPAA